jgi:hypothetical protein
VLHFLNVSASKLSPLVPVALHLDGLVAAIPEELSIGISFENRAAEFVVRRLGQTARFCASIEALAVRGGFCP